MPNSNEPNREREFRFEVTLFVRGGRITGAFKNLTAKTPLTRITKGECLNGVCCFEVPDDPAEGTDVNTWCVSSQRDALVGSRNGGAMTPGGPGIGARFFPVKARRVPKPKPAPYSVSP